MPTISDKELIKWTSILGSYRMKELYFMGKVQLSGKQLELLINLRKFLVEDYEQSIEVLQKTRNKRY